MLDKELLEILSKRRHVTDEPHVLGDLAAPIKVGVVKEKTVVLKETKKTAVPDYASVM